MIDTHSTNSLTRHFIDQSSRMRLFIIFEHSKHAHSTVDEDVKKVSTNLETLILRDKLASNWSLVEISTHFCATSRQSIFRRNYGVVIVPVKPDILQMTLL